jgi:predicted HAD superfamily Cof-like phosphohydrolase
MNNADMLREFHRAVGSPTPESPTAPGPDILTLRHALITEEYEEVSSAFATLEEARRSGDPGDITPLIHELTDLLYVTYGTILACGIDPDEVFEEVHRANMRKTKGPRRPDGKQLKPEGWRPADVAGVIERQKRR